MGLLDLIPGIRDAPKAVKYVLIVVGIVAVGGVLMALAAAIGNLSGNSRNQAPSPQLVSNITWEDVNKVYSNSSRLTNLQKEEQWKTFKGQRVRWTGKVHSITDNLTLQVQVGFNLFYDVKIHLDLSQRATALTLRQGDTITFEATLKSWGSGNSWSPHTLGDGVIVSTPPPNPNNNVKQPLGGPPKFADQGVGKLAAFKKIVARLDAHPGPLAGQAKLDVYADELRVLFNNFQAVPFNAQVQRQEATEIVNLFDSSIKGQYRGQIFNLIEASVYEIRTALMR